MAQKFSAQVHEIIRRNTGVMEAVARESTQKLIEEAQKPKGKGGKMPLDTGFLRASGRLSLTGLPTGPTRAPATEQDKGKGGKTSTHAAPETVQLTGFKLGMSIFFGWTAIYARKQNLYHGFLDSAVNRWQKIVDDTVRKLRR